MPILQDRRRLRPVAKFLLPSEDVSGPFTRAFGDGLRRSDVCGIAFPGRRPATGHGLQTGRGTRIFCISGETRLGEGILYTSALEQFKRLRHDRFAALAGKVRFSRFSHDCYAAGLLALGTIDLLVESNVFDYDILPQMPIIEAAGGIVSDWDGQPLQDAPQYDTVLMAANEAIHRAALDALKYS
ncbi:hypothetical protein LJR098_005060 [Rhizobium sp. LjRoot98]|uniref:inositol monophosphatase family protein n=1 Tax=Rhizobium sp. LjRoot98 TaxID=3342345 RepID=UPI003ECFE1C6